MAGGSRYRYQTDWGQWIRINIDYRKDEAPRLSLGGFTLEDNRNAYHYRPVSAKLFRPRRVWLFTKAWWVICKTPDIYQAFLSSDDPRVFGFEGERGQFFYANRCRAMANVLDEMTQEEIFQPVRIPISLTEQTPLTIPTPFESQGSSIWGDGA